MAWTTPKTWSSEPLTSADLNTYIRDNQNHLQTVLNNNEQYITDESSEYTTSSGSFVDVDADNFSHTITTNGGDVLVGFSGIAKVSSGYYVSLTVKVDDIVHFPDDGILCIRTENVNNNASFVALITGLSAGSHTFALQWKVNNGTGRIFNGDGGSNEDVHSQFWVQEI